MSQTIEREILEREIELLTSRELSELARYAEYLRYSRNNKDDSWADAPLTPEEETAFRVGRANLERGDYLTLEDFRSQANAL